MNVTELYKKTQEDKKINADKAWETIKFSVTILSTLVTVTIALIGAINYLAIDPSVKPVFVSSTVLIPILMAVIVRIVGKNFERECIRMYESMAILMKIEEELPKRNVLAGSNFWEEDYFPSYWKEPKYINTQKYIESMMGDSKKFYSSMKPIFSIFGLISLLLIVLVVFIAVAPFII